MISIVVFKNGQFRDLYNWHTDLTYGYWPMWARQLGCMLQILPIILVPLGFIVQTWRYLSSGPPDILDVSTGIFTLIICPVLHCLHFCSYFTAFVSPCASFLLHNFVFPLSSFLFVFYCFCISFCLLPSFTTLSSHCLHFCSYFTAFVSPSASFLPSQLRLPIVFISVRILLLLYLLLPPSFLHNFVFPFLFPFSSFVTLMPKLTPSF